MKGKLFSRCGIVIGLLSLSSCDLFVPTVCEDGSVKLEIGCDNGLDPVVSTRQCPAFYHPEYASWVSEVDGDIASFSDSSGVTALFTTGAVIKNDAYTKQETHNNTIRELSCELSASTNVTSSSPFPQIDYEYFHTDYVNSEVDNERLILTLKIKTDEGEALPQLFSIYLETNSDRDGVNAVHDTQYYPVFSMNGVGYTDVISQSVLDHIIQAVGTLDVPAESNVVKVFLARGVGLLRFELADGRVFTRNL